VTAQPTPTHTHVWDGGDLPDWLQLDDYHLDNDQLVIYTPDSPTRPQPGWSLIRWTDGTTTVASPTVAGRVYGPDGLAGRLARAEAASDGELRRQLDAAICALGRSETELAQKRDAIARVRTYAQTAIDAGDTGPGVHLGRLLLHLLDGPPADDAWPARHVHVTITNPDEYTANRAALSLVDWLAAEFPRHHVTTDAREWEQPVEEARLAQSGIDTPGCDCGHDGMGVSWHSDDCPWRRAVVDCPGRPTPG
jgi:hypothetical protein